MKKTLRNRNTLRPKKAVSIFEQNISRFQKHRLWWLTATLGLVGWLLVNAPTALQNWSAFKEWYQVDQGLTGYWTNDLEGMLGEPELESIASETEDKITLVLEVKGSDIQGEIYSDAIPKHFPATWKSFMVRGKKSFFSQINLTAFDYIFGKETVTANFKIEPDGNNLSMTVTSLSKVPYFPDEFHLSKTDTPPAQLSAQLKPSN
jgi:hypothetical protein